MNIFFFIAYGHMLLILFLLVSTALPDEVEKDGVALKAYYFQNHRYFWGLMASVVVLSIIIGFIKQLDQLGSVNIFNLLSMSIFIILLLTLAISKRYWLHSVIVVLLVIQVILEIFGK